MRAAALPALALLGAVLFGVFLPGHAAAQGGMPASGAVVEQRFRVQVVPAYEGKLRMNQTAPMVVRIENLGPDAGAEILIDSQSQGSTVRYPVALPAGAKKDVPILIPAGTNTGQILLSTERGTIQVPAIVAYENARATLLAIGDDPGSFAFMETLTAPKPKTPSYSYTDTASVVTTAYMRPEALPPSEAALDRTACVALMPGSERLNASQIAALRRYVLRGGHLVLFGGASAPILTDPRLADLVPFVSLTPQEITVAGHRVSIQRPTPTSGATIAESGGVPIVRRTYGAGRVSLFAADPTDGPFRAVSGRAKLVANGLDLQRSGIMAGTWLSAGPENAPGGGSPVGTLPGEVDPFSLPIPPTLSILYVLGAYFLVVLPVNFLILKGMKRLEWAWFTAPLLALGFAGVLFRNAGSLYSTGLSHATRAVVFAGSGGREGLALGKGQIFFPNAARGAIPIAGAEAIGVDLFRSGEDYPYYRRQETTRPIDVIVTDHPSVPDYGSTALEFRDLDFHQTIDLGQGVRVVQSRGSNGRRIEVFNGSPYTLRNVAVIPARRSGADAPSAAGQSVVTTGSNVPVLRSAGAIRPGERSVCDQPGTSTIGSLSAPLWATSPLMIAGIDDAPLGPRLGTIIHARSWTQLVVSGEMR